MDTLKLLLKFAFIFFGIIGGIIGLIMLIQFLFNTDGPFGEYMLYRKARENTFYAEDYLKKYPEGKYFKEIELSYSRGMFLEAKNLALDTTYLENNDQCIKLFDFIRKFKNAPDYIEAIKIAEEYGYRNYSKLKDWKRIYDYMETFPESRNTKELTILKDKSIDSALLKIEGIIKEKSLNTNQAELLKAILNGSKNKSQQMSVCLKFMPDISIGNPENFKQFSYEGKIIEKEAILADIPNFPYFSDLYLKNKLSERLFEAFSKFLPGKNFFTFDTIQKEDLPIFAMKCKVSNIFTDGNSGLETPYIGEYFSERYPTKTISTTKRVSEYSKVQKEWIYKDVTETKTETDYNSPPSYDHEGYFFYLMFDLKCNILIPGNDESYKVDLVYKPKIGKAPYSERLKTIYDHMVNETAWEFTRKFIPDQEQERINDSPKDSIN